MKKEKKYNTINYKFNNKIYYKLIMNEYIII